MKREFHAPFCERPGAKFLRPTHHSLHRVLDVPFNEDHCRIRDRNAVQSFSLLRKIAINLVRRDQTSKASLQGRQKMAAWNNHYMEQVLTGIFHA